MKNKVKWRYFVKSLMISIGISIIIVNFLGQTKIYEYIIIFLAAIAVPSIYISSSVIIGVDDVRRDVEKMTKMESYLSDYEDDARAKFYNYFSDNCIGFSVNYKELNKDIGIILSRKIGKNFSEVSCRMIDSAYNCFICIKQFKYVDAHIMLYETDRCTINIPNEDKIKEKIYITFRDKDKLELCGLLKEIYNPENKNKQPLEVLSVDELERLRHLLTEYNNVCYVLYNKIRREQSAYAGAVKDLSEDIDANEVRYDE